MEEVKRTFLNSTSANAEKTMFLHLYHWPTDGQLVVRKQNNKIRKAYLMIGNQPHLLRFWQSDEGVKIDLTPHLLYRNHTLIALELE